MYKNNSPWEKTILSSYPLSRPLSPSFGPKQPTVIPGYGSSVLGSLIGTTKLCKPWHCPSGVYNWAYTTAIVAIWPKFPDQHLLASKSAEWRTNS